MARKNGMAWILTAVFALVLTGAVTAQSPTPEAAASPAQVEVSVNQTEPAPAAPIETKTETTVNKTEVADPAPAPVSSTSTTVWGFDGKTVLIGGALLLGIILIAVAAAGRDQTTVVR